MRILKFSFVHEITKIVDSCSPKQRLTSNESNWFHPAINTVPRQTNVHIRVRPDDIYPPIRKPGPVGALINSERRAARNGRKQRINRFISRSVRSRKINNNHFTAGRISCLHRQWRTVPMFNKLIHCGWFFAAKRTHEWENLGRVTQNWERMYT